MALIIGILTIAVSLGLFRGSNVARIIMAVVFALNLVVAVWALVISPTSGSGDRGRARPRRSRAPVLKKANAFFR